MHISDQTVFLDPLVGHKAPSTATGDLLVCLRVRNDVDVRLGVQNRWSLMLSDMNIDLPTELRSPNTHWTDRKTRVRPDPQKRRFQGFRNACLW